MEICHSACVLCACIAVRVCGCVHCAVDSLSWREWIENCCYCFVFVLLLLLLHRWIIRVWTEWRARVASFIFFFHFIAPCDANAFIYFKRSLFKCLPLSKLLSFSLFLSLRCLLISDFIILHEFTFGLVRINEDAEIPPRDSWIKADALHITGDLMKTQCMNSNRQSSKSERSEQSVNQPTQEKQINSFFFALQYKSLFLATE